MRSRFVLASYLLVFAFAIVVLVPTCARAADTLALPKLDAPASMNGTIDASWDAAAKLSLATDFTNRRPSPDATNVVIAREADAIDIAFAAHDRGSRIASQQTNSSSVLSDDYVGAYFWPQGTHGFAYAFVANPRGARYQVSSENSAYAPQWTAVAKDDPGGYTVTMRIPLSIMRTGGSNTWRVQFVRQSVATNTLDVWTYSPTATSATDPVYAGSISNFATLAESARPKPRAQVYALGELTNAANGGNTSRIGADLSLPVTPTSSLVAAIHPDYSNVEIDQQTISPTPFAYQYSEVRPFFTQVGQSFGQSFSCSNCPQLLYTPSIPTFRDAYAYEGTQGPLTFAAFDAVGNGRADQGQVLDVTSQTTSEVSSLALQHISADTTLGVHDETTSFTSGIQDRRSHLFAYVNAATERGSLVTSPAEANYLELGGGSVTSTTTVSLNYQTVGSQFAPYDGFVTQNDITGYELFAKKTINFSAHDLLHDINAQVFEAEYRNRFALRAQEESGEQVAFDFRDLATVKLAASESAVRIEQGEFLPFDGNSIVAGYRINTATPTYAGYAGGPYYHGTLDSWTYVSTLQMAPSVHLRLESDEDKYLTTHSGEQGSVLWLDRASLDWQLNRQASLDLGARRLVGVALPGAYGPPGTPALGAGNVTAAFHLLQQKNEFYIVYGDPNSLSTKPALYLKWIRYIGAPKGT
jgi:hypothetical protein